MALSITIVSYLSSFPWVCVDDSLLAPGKERGFGVLSNSDSRRISFNTRHAVIPTERVSLIFNDTLHLSGLVKCVLPPALPL